MKNDAEQIERYIDKSIIEIYQAKDQWLYKYNFQLFYFWMID